VRSLAAVILSRIIGADSIHQELELNKTETWTFNYQHGVSLLVVNMLRNNYDPVLKLVIELIMVRVSENNRFALETINEMYNLAEELSNVHNSQKSTVSPNVVTR
jgi:hypothetical protein